MPNILSIAVSGLNASANRIANAASSIVNASSTKKISPLQPSFMPRDVVDVSGDHGADLNADLIASKEAQISYAADARVIKTADQLQKSLIDALN